MGVRGYEMLHEGSKTCIHWTCRGKKERTHHPAKEGDDMGKGQKLEDPWNLDWEIERESLSGWKK